MTAQLVARDLHFAHGPHTVLAGVSLTVAPGHRIGVVGPNGVGKSTLLRLLAGLLPPTSGSVEVVPGDAVVALLSQELDAGEGETVGELVARRTGVAAVRAEFDAASAAVAGGEPGSADRFDAALSHYLRLGAAEHESTRDQVFADLGIGSELVDLPVDRLSGGQQARVGLACVLLSTADVLLLDEPTNDLDLAGLDTLERHVLAVRAGLVVVSHDREFLERVTTSIVEIDEHSRAATRFEGGYATYLETRAAARRHAEEAFADYQTKRQHLAGQVQQKREWANRGVKAATKRPDDGDKHIRQRNLAQTEHLAGKAKQAERALQRLDANDRVDKPWEGWDLRLTFATTGRPGSQVVTARGLVVERGGFRLGPIDLDIRHGERVALVGANGSGKSTLLHACLGMIPPTRGEAGLGPSVRVGHLDQARLRFSSEQALLDTYVADTGADATEARSQLAKLGLDAERVARPTARLSPGERTRAVLAAFAQVGVNLMVLDEPTNHLDVPAIEQLESALDQFPGTVILVTHDRRLLESVRLTRRIELAGGGIVTDHDLS